MTIGATLHQAPDSLATAVRRADRIMYQGKVHGWNRVSPEENLEDAVYK